LVDEFLLLAVNPSCKDEPKELPRLQNEIHGCPDAVEENQQHRAPTGTGQSAEFRTKEGTQAKPSSMVAVRLNSFTLRGSAIQAATS
jgi:hypothetical protein